MWLDDLDLHIAAELVLYDLEIYVTTELVLCDLDLHTGAELEMRVIKSSKYLCRRISSGSLVTKNPGTAAFSNILCCSIAYINEVEFTRVSTVQPLLKNRSRWPSSADPVAECWSCSGGVPILHASGKRQPNTTQIWICRSAKFALDLDTGSGNLTKVK